MNAPEVDLPATTVVDVVNVASISGTLFEPQGYAVGVFLFAHDLL